MTAALTAIPSGSWTPALTAADVATLWGIAGDSLTWLVGGRATPFAWNRYPRTHGLAAELGSFVTLHRGGVLRGCIGRLEPAGPLCESVHANAVRAGSSDPRFPPLTADERRGLEIDISVIGPLIPIDALGDFRVGQQGLILDLQGRRAVFLPGVAAEQGWTAQDTAGQLCVKAGLAASAWQRGPAQFRVFETVVISEQA